MRATTAKLLNCKHLKGSEADRTHLLNSACETRPDVLKKGSGGSRIIQPPGLKKSKPDSVLKPSIYTEKIPAENIAVAQQFCLKLEPTCNTERKRLANQKTLSYFKELETRALQSGEPTVQRLTHSGYSDRLQPYIGGRRFASGGPGLQRCLRAVRSCLCS